jgi:chitosanase
MTDATLDFIRRILSVAETDKPEWDPGAFYVYADGNDGRRQGTLSIGFTADGGNLRKVLELYCAEGGKFAADFAPWIRDLKAGNPGTSTAFQTLIKKAAKEDPLFAEVQKKAFEELYLQPAFVWAETHGFKLELSHLVIADSFLHSGSMLGFLMAKFPEKKPNAGGDEKKWIVDYLNARYHWLQTHSNKILNKTTYRAQCFMHEATKGNWDLTAGPVVMNGTRINLV